MRLPRHGGLRTTGPALTSNPNLLARPVFMPDHADVTEDNDEEDMRRLASGEAIGKGSIIFGVL